jgi:TIR domain/Jacalin-like lectin domain
MPFDVFISYSSKDKTTADATCAALESARIRCWIAPRDIRAGIEYAAGIIEGIDSCRIMVLIFSSNANMSPQIHRELERAVSNGLTLIPFRIEDTLPTAAMQYYLSAIHWLDAYTPPLVEHLGRLVEQVKADLQVAAPSGTTVSVPLGETAAPPAKPVRLDRHFIADNARLAVIVAVGLACATAFAFWYFAKPTYVVTKSTAFGGNGGVAFDDTASNPEFQPVAAFMVVVALNAGNTSQRVIGSLQVRWAKGIGKLHGNLLPNTQTTILAKDEVIGRVDVSWMSYDFKTPDSVKPQWVSGLTIYTNKRVYSFGNMQRGNTGQCILGFGEILIGFFGRSGDAIDQLGCLIAKPK